MENLTESQRQELVELLLRFTAPTRREASVDERAAHTEPDPEDTQVRDRTAQSPSCESANPTTAATAPVSTEQPVSALPAVPTEATSAAPGSDSTGMTQTAPAAAPPQPTPAEAAHSKAISRETDGTEKCRSPPRWASVNGSNKQQSPPRVGTDSILGLRDAEHPSTGSKSKRKSLAQSLRPESGEEPPTPRASKRKIARGKSALKPTALASDPAARIFEVSDSEAEGEQPGSLNRPVGQSHSPTPAPKKRRLRVEGPTQPVTEPTEPSESRKPRNVVRVEIPMTSKKPLTRASRSQTQASLEQKPMIARPVDTIKAIRQLASKFYSDYARVDNAIWEKLHEARKLVKGDKEVGNTLKRCEQSADDAVGLVNEFVTELTRNISESESWNQGTE